MSRAAACRPWSALERSGSLPSHPQDGWPFARGVDKALYSPSRLVMVHSAPTPTWKSPEKEKKYLFGVDFGRLVQHRSAQSADEHLAADLWVALGCSPFGQWAGKHHVAAHRLHQSSCLIAPVVYYFHEFVDGIFIFGSLKLRDVIRA